MGGHSAWKKRVAKGELAKGSGGAIMRHRPRLGRRGKDLILNRKGFIAGGNPKKLKKQERRRAAAALMRQKKEQEEKLKQQKQQRSHEAMDDDLVDPTGDGMEHAKDCKTVASFS